MEKRPDDGRGGGGQRKGGDSGGGSVIIASVVENSPASRLFDLRRGDVVCRANTDGQDEYPFEEFLTVLCSLVRPVRFEVRRIES